MRLRQEQIVFAAALAVLGLLAWSATSGGAALPRGSRARGTAAELDHHSPPQVEVALPARDATPPLRRALFAPPRDTHPLPPLELVEPPRRPFPVLLPPSDPGPAPRAYGLLLREELAEVDLPDLFRDPEDDPAAAGDLGPGAAEEGESAVAELLRQASGTEDDPFVDETPAEREARLAGYRARYDWIHRGAGLYEFGRIVNEDRIGLKTDLGRAGEVLLFVRVDPETGQEWFRNVGAPPIPIQRGAIVDFAFADTIANALELRRRELGEELTRSDFEAAMELAARAVRHRLNAPRALEVAEELYRRCTAYDPKDPEPRLGLAACQEAGFRFEEAFATYEELLADFGHRAEVHVRMARLEERFLLHERAEERLRHAVSVDRSSWEAWYGLGSFLARRGRQAEAVEALEQANRLAPSAPERLADRVAIRISLGDAHLALGDVEEARRVYAAAQAADPTDARALAGLLATGLYDGTGGADGAPADDGPLTSVTAPEATAEAGFDLLLVRGLHELRGGAHEEARDLLQLAAGADPLRAHRALGALAYLAQATGNDAEALAFAEEALERDPSDAYALYLRGRLLGLQDDYEGARESLLGALDAELDFEDALVALGETAFGLGRFEDAERYLERAVSIGDERPQVHALRGINFLRLGAVPSARDAFDRALEGDPEEPTARAGNAWCAYLEGDPTEALILLANLDEGRRELPEEDPWRIWAREQIERVRDHAEKVEWRDNFNRTRLINQWFTREGVGPVVSMDDGAVKIEGVFERVGSTQIYREYTASDLVSFSADVWISPEANVRAGIFVARERQRRRDQDVIAEASVSRHKDGSLQVRIVRQGQPQELTDMQQTLPTGEWVRLSVERTGEASRSTVTVSIDGIPLVEGIPLASIGTATSPVLVGLFAEGETGRQVLVKMDDVAVVYRGNR